jgi:hypothetical protein
VTDLPPREPELGPRRTAPPNADATRLGQAETQPRFLQTLTRAGVEKRMGLRLYRCFIDAGLPPPAMTLESGVAGAGMLPPGAGRTWSEASYPSWRDSVLPHPPRSSRTPLQTGFSRK